MRNVHPGIGAAFAGLSVAALILGASLTGCASTSPVLNTSTQSAIATDLADAQTALSTATVVVAVAESTGELTGSNATTANTVLADVQTVLTSAKTAVAAGSTTDISAQLADLQTLLSTAAKTAPSDAKLISSIQAVVAALQLVEADQLTSTGNTAG